MAELGKTTTSVNLRTGARHAVRLSRRPAARDRAHHSRRPRRLASVDVAGSAGFIKEQFVARDSQAIPPGLTGGGPSDPLPNVALAPDAAN